MGYRALWPDKTIRWLLATGRAFYGHPDKPTRILGVVVDITEQKQAQEVIRASKEKLQNTLGKGEIGVWELDLSTINLGKLTVSKTSCNVLSNCTRYARGKPVRVILSGDAHTPTLKVADQGISIARQDHDRIFQRFERATSTEEGSGLGLGLFIVKQIVEAHGGTITLESELEEDSTFSVALPL